MRKKLVFIIFIIFLFGGCVAEKNIEVNQNINENVNKNTNSEDIVNEIGLYQISSEAINLPGDGQHKEFRDISLKKGLAIIKVVHKGSADFLMDYFDAEWDWAGAIVSEKGDYEGTCIVKIENEEGYLFDVLADGEWSVAIDQPEIPEHALTLGKVSGKGDQVTDFFKLKQGLYTFNIAHDGAEEIKVKLFDGQGTELANLKHSDKENLSQGIYLIEVEADGNWTVEVN